MFEQARAAKQIRSQHLGHPKKGARRNLGDGACSLARPRAEAKHQKMDGARESPMLGTAESASDPVTSMVKLT